MKTINVPNEVWKQLNVIKDEEKIMHFADVIKLLIAQRGVSKNNLKESIKHQTSIRSQVLHLMNDCNTWNISDLVAKVSIDRQDSDELRDFVEAVLESIPEITKVDDSEYRLTQASID